MVAPQNSITLYDVESNLKEKTLSQYSVRLRLLLDYKKIPYGTLWISSFSKVESIAKAVGALPTKIKADGNPGYTIPFITITSSDKPILALSDSHKIAQYIEGLYPDPDGKLLPAETRVFQSIVSQYLTENVIVGAMYQVIFSDIVRAIPADEQDWFLKSRKSVNGKDIQQLVPQDEEGIAAAWKHFDATFDQLAAHLDAGGEGNFRITGDVSYAEFELVSILNLVKRASFDVAWKRLEGRNGGRWTKLMDLPVYRSLLPANRVEGAH